MSHSNNFDQLRLILAVLVFFAHWNILTNQHLTNPLFHLSGFAVDMFFIVSGFLIFWSFDNDQNQKNFYIKRFFRIFPLYAFLIVLQTLFFIGFSDGSLTQIVKYFVSNILFLNFLAPSVGSTLSGLEVDAINGSLWTLKNEVMFYALVPFIFFLYKKWGGYFLASLYGLSVLYLFVIEYMGNTISNGLSKLYFFATDYIGDEKLLVQFPGQLRLFVVGIMLYVLFDKLNNKNIYPFLLSSLVLILFFEDDIFFKYTFYPVCIGILVVFIAYYVKLIDINFDFSYSLYILHFPVIQLFLYFDVNPAHPVVSFCVIFGITLILSYFSEKYIEKRFIRVGKNIIRKDHNAPD